MKSLILLLFVFVSCGDCYAQYPIWQNLPAPDVLVRLDTLPKKDTVFIKNVGDYQEGKVNILVSPSGRKSVVTIEDEPLGPEGVNPYIETLIFDSSVVILCLYERRVGKEILTDTLAVDYYRKSVFFNPRNYDPIITKEDREFQKLIGRKLNEKQ